MRTGRRESFTRSVRVGQRQTGWRREAAAATLVPQVFRVDVLDERAVNVFTDGSSYSHPRRGGIGIRLITVGANGHEIVHEEH